MAVPLTLKWHGGKYYLAAWIIDHFPIHTHYVEPFFGGGAVLFRKQFEGISEVVNDIDWELTNYFDVVKSKRLFREFQQQVALTPFSEVEFKRSLRTSSKKSDRVAAAVKFFVRNRQSRQGLGTSFATLSKKRTRSDMNEQVSAWLGSVDGLEEAHQRLQRVVIFNKDATDVIKSEDSPETFYYIDPTYMQETRTAKQAYRHEMSDYDHCRLLAAIADPNKPVNFTRVKSLLPIEQRELRRLQARKFTSKFALSGYRSKLYDDNAKLQGWKRSEMEIDNKASSKKDANGKKPKRIECLWTNYSPSAERKKRKKEMAG